MPTIFNSPMLTLLQSGPKTPEQQVQRATSPLQQSVNGRQRISLPDFTSQPLQIKPIIPARDATGTAQSVQHNTHTDQVPINVDERLKQNRQILGDVVETAIDFTPIIGDIKGLTWDPIKAGIEGGFRAGLSMAGLGLIGLAPGIGDIGKTYLKTIPLYRIKEYRQWANKLGVNLNAKSDRDIWNALNNRIERLQHKAKTDNAERVTIFGDNHIHQGFTYKDGENVGFIELEPIVIRLTPKKTERGYGINFIKNTTLNKNDKVPHQTVYGLDAGLQFSKGAQQGLYSGRYLLNPEATLKDTEKYFKYQNTNIVGKLPITDTEEYIARSKPNSTISEIEHDLKEYHNYPVPIFDGESTLPGYSLPLYFDLNKKYIDGRNTYLKEDADPKILQYVTDKPGWYVRKILELKDPTIINHSTYSIFPHPQALYEKVVNRDDLPSFLDFGILEYKQGGKINEDNTNRN